MYYTQSPVCQRGFCEHISSNKFRSSSPWAYARFAKGKTQPFGVAGRIACREAVCDLWRNQAFIGGGGRVVGVLQGENFSDGAICCVLENIFINFFTQVKILR